MKRAGLVIAVSGLFFFAQLAQAQWTSAKRLTWNSTYSYGPTIAVDSSGKLYVVWNEYLPEDNNEVYFKMSPDGGSTWTASKRLTWNPEQSWSPRIAVDPWDNLHLVWAQYPPYANLEIYYRKSTDKGVTWIPSRRLTWNSVDDPSIAADALGNLHLVSQNMTGIYYKKSTDGGVAWTPNTRLSWTGHPHYGAIIAVDSTNNPQFVWANQDYSVNRNIYYKKSTDGGSTWMPSESLIWSTHDLDSPTIAVDSYGNPHAFWCKYVSSWQIYHRNSTDGGSTWTSTKRFTWTSGNSGLPFLAIDSSDNLHVVWCDSTPGNYEIFYTKSTDGGSTWTARKRLTWNSGYSCSPKIAIDSFDNLHVVWDDETQGNCEIYYKKYVKQ
jgi:hypothetical protein